MTAQIPIDTATGLQSGPPMYRSTSADEVIVGYLVTHLDGYEARLGPDLALATVYAARQRAVRLEAMYVRRTGAPSRQIDAGCAIAGEGGGR